MPDSERRGREGRDPSVAGDMGNEYFVCVCVSEKEVMVISKGNEATSKSPIFLLGRHP